MSADQQKPVDGSDALPTTPEDKLIETLQQQTFALNAFAGAVMELAQAVADMLSLGAEVDSAPKTYLDGSKVDG